MLIQDMDINKWKEKTILNYADSMNKSIFNNNSSISLVFEANK